MIGLLLNRYVIGGVLALTIVSGAYLKGRSDGGAACREQAVKATQAQITERSKTDAKINKLDPGGLCELLGGMLVNGQCQ